MKEKTLFILIENKNRREQLLYTTLIITFTFTATVHLAFLTYSHASKSLRFGFCRVTSTELIRIFFIPLPNLKNLQLRLSLLLDLQKYIIKNIMWKSEKISAY